uniref:Uncharacterized protein n=1 Tax=Amphimedon queenslandica TaxID=400682 RepID=A0A1X7UNA2_AMPQE
MKHCGVEAAITLSLLFFSLSSGAPTSNTGTTDPSDLLGNISLSLSVLEKIISESDYVTFCKLGLEAAEITGESSSIDLPEVTIQTAAQNLKDICNWFSTSTTNGTNCTSTEESAGTVKELCSPVLGLKEIKDGLTDAKTSVQNHGSYTSTQSQVESYIQELREEASESVAHFIPNLS